MKKAKAKAKEITGSLFRPKSKPSEGNAAKPSSTLQVNDPQQLPAINEAAGPSSADELDATPSVREESVAHVDSSIPESIADPLSGGETFDDLHSPTTLVKVKAMPAENTATITSQGTQYLKGWIGLPVDAMPTRMSTRSLAEFQAAVTKFTENYKRFASKHAQYLVVEDDFYDAFLTAKTGNDISQAGQIFGDQVSASLGAFENKKTATKGNWTTRLGNFFTKLYPVARLTLSLAGAVGDVTLKLDWL
jgi:hypothetical protein